MPAKKKLSRQTYKSYSCAYKAVYPQQVMCILVDGEQEWLPSLLLPQLDRGISYKHGSSQGAWKHVLSIYAGEAVLVSVGAGARVIEVFTDPNRGLRLLMDTMSRNAGYFTV